MTASSIDPRVAKLIADIKLANNGYLLLEYMRGDEKAFARECAVTGVVSITNGTVHLPVTKPEFYKTQFPTKAFAMRHEGPDYEGAILSRQANEGFYD